MSAPNNMTLLEYVQQTLNSLHSDLVNSIDDTEESLLVANLVKNSYYRIIEASNAWEFNHSLTQLIGCGDLLSPTKFLIPDDIISIETFGYNVTTQTTGFQYEPIQFQPPLIFLRTVQARVSSTGLGSNIQPVDIGNGIQIFVYNNVAPSIYTSFDQQIIYCDAYNSAVDDTLKSLKSEIYVTMRQPWQMENTFIPNLPYNMQQLLLEKTIARAYYELRGQTHIDAIAYEKSVTQRSKFTSSKTPTAPQIVRWGRQAGWYGGGWPGTATDL